MATYSAWPFAVPEMHFSRYRSVHFDRGTVLFARWIQPFVVPDFVNAHYRSRKIDHGTNLLLAVSATGGARKRTPLSGEVSREA